MGASSAAQVMDSTIEPGTGWRGANRDLVREHGFEKLEIEGQLPEDLLPGQGEQRARQVQDKEAGEDQTGHGLHADQGFLGQAIGRTGGVGPHGEVSFRLR